MVWASKANKKEIWLRRSHFVLLFYQVWSLQKAKGNLETRAFKYFSCLYNFCSSVTVLKILCTTEVWFMLRATSKWRNRRGYPVSELLALGRWTAGHPSALRFRSRVRKPRATVGPWGETHQLHSCWRTEPQRTWKTRQESISVLSKRQGEVVALQEKESHLLLRHLPDHLPVHREVAPQDEGRNIPLCYAVSRNRGWHTMGFPGFVLPLFAGSCSLRWRSHSLFFPSLSCSSPTPKYTIVGSLPSPALSPPALTWPLCREKG